MVRVPSSMHLIVMLMILDRIRYGILNNYAARWPLSSEPPNLFLVSHATWRRVNCHLRKGQRRWRVLKAKLRPFPSLLPMVLHPFPPNTTGFQAEQKRRQGWYYKIFVRHYRTYHGQGPKLRMKAGFHKYRVLNVNYNVAISDFQ